MVAERVLAAARACSAARWLPGAHFADCRLAAHAARRQKNGVASQRILSAPMKTRVVGIAYLVALAPLSAAMPGPIMFTPAAPIPAHELNFSPNFSGHPGDLTLLARPPTGAPTATRKSVWRRMGDWATPLAPALNASRERDLTLSPGPKTTLRPAPKSPKSALQFDAALPPLQTSLTQKPAPAAQK
jgi:hypothetical protein